MKKHKITALLLALLLAVLLVACNQGINLPDDTADPQKTQAPESSEPSPTGEDTSITITDMTGREIVLDAPAEKVVALTASDCEIIYAIGAGDKLVGRGEYCDYPPESASVPSVQSGNETNIEQIIALAPQVVLLNTMAQTEEQIAALENAGIKVAVSNALDIVGTYESIELIGKITGKNDEAAAVIKDMQKTFADISEKSTGDGTKTIYFEVSPLEYGLWVAGSETFMEELANMLGLENAFSDIQGWGEVSQEQVIERSPDYIVTFTMSYDGGPGTIEEITARSGWQDITAIKNGAVLSGDSNAMVRPGPRLADAAEALYAFVYEGVTQARES